MSHVDLAKRFPTNIQYFSIANSALKEKRNYNEHVFRQLKSRPCPCRSGKSVLWVQESAAFRPWKVAHDEARILCFGRHATQLERCPLRTSPLCPAPHPRGWKGARRHSLGFAASFATSQARMRRCRAPNAPRLPMKPLEQGSGVSCSLFAQQSAGFRALHPQLLETKYHCDSVSGAQQCVSSRGHPQLLKTEQLGASARAHSCSLFAQQSASFRAPHPQLLETEVHCDNGLGAQQCARKIQSRSR